MIDHTRHPIAQRFAEITRTDLFTKEGAPVDGSAGERWEALCEDISLRGIQEPIVVLKGTTTILDGWHRHHACLHTGAVPRYDHREFADEKAITEFILGSHLRKLTEPKGVWELLVAEGMYDPKRWIGRSGRNKAEESNANSWQYSTTDVARLSGRDRRAVGLWNRQWAAENDLLDRTPQETRKERDEETKRREEAEREAAEAQAKEYREEIERLKKEHRSLLDATATEKDPVAAEETMVKIHDQKEENKEALQDEARSALMENPPDGEQWELVVDSLSGVAVVRVARTLGLIQ